ncbi:MAG: hypothetical protein DUD32_06015 [Lactobacillus sp.]|nr:MAG: hypothetical protein DUD32_06015 [Lactobacillus sp.]
MADKKIQVARILDPYKVIITAGKNIGTKVGETFTIVGESADPILDPTTHEILGAIKVKKAKIKVIELYEKFSICESFENEFASIVNPWGQSNGKKALQVSINETSSMDTSAVDPMIHVGDEVIKD